MNKPIAIVGFGGHGRVVAASLMALGRRVVAASDLNPSAVCSSKWGFPIISDEQVRLGYAPSEVDLALGIGSIFPTGKTSGKHLVIQSYEKLGYKFVGFVHPTAWIAFDAKISSTTQVHAGAIVQTGAVVGDFTIINTRASVDHDCKIESHCHIAPGTTLSGDVSIGEGSHLGTGCNVIQGIRIGLECFVAAGATVVRNVDDGMSVRGVPASVFSRLTRTRN